MPLDITGDNETAFVMMPKRIDADNAPALEQDFRALTGWNSPVVILDFSATEYIASAGLRVLLVVTRNLLKRDTKTALVSLKPQVLRIFDMAGFTQIFSIFPTREEAVKAIQE